MGQITERRCLLINETWWCSPPFSLVALLYISGVLLTTYSSQLATCYVLCILGLLSKIKRSKYPAITAEEESISIPLQTLAQVRGLFTHSGGILLSGMTHRRMRNFPLLRRDELLSAHRPV
jgi:hypothetical protein